MLRKIPCRSNRLSGESSSAMRPLSITQIRSYSRIVLSRCAMHSSVLPRNAVVMVFWIFWSVSKSTDDVASSQTMMRLSRTRARASAINWRWPREKLSPSSSTVLSRWMRLPWPFSAKADELEGGASSGTWSTRSAFRSADQSSRSLCSLKGSRLDRIVPRKSVGSWGMMASLDRRSSNPTVAMFTPSMWMDPPESSTSRNKADMMLDLPAPVRPTTPIRSPPCTFKSMPCRTSGRPARYRICTCSNTISPSKGQPSPTGWRWAGASSSSWVP